MEGSTTLDDGGSLHLLFVLNPLVPDAGRPHRPHGELPGAVFPGEAVRGLQ